MTQLFPPSPLAAAQAFLLSLPAVRFKGLAGLCPAHEPERRAAPGSTQFTSASFRSSGIWGGGTQPEAGVGGRVEEWWGMVHSAQSALQARLAKAWAAEGRARRAKGNQRSLTHRKDSKMKPVFTFDKPWRAVCVGQY